MFSYLSFLVVVHAGLTFLPLDFMMCWICLQVCLRYTQAGQEHPYLPSAPLATVYFPCTPCTTHLFSHLSFVVLGLDAVVCSKIPPHGANKYSAMSHSPSSIRFSCAMRCIMTGFFTHLISLVAH